MRGFWKCWGADNCAAPGHAGLFFKTHHGLPPQLRQQRAKRAVFGRIDPLGREDPLEVTVEDFDPCYLVEHDAGLAHPRHELLGKDADHNDSFEKYYNKDLDLEEGNTLSFYNCL